MGALSYSPVDTNGRFTGEKRFVLDFNDSAGNDKLKAQHAERVLRGYGYKSKAHGVRRNGRIGGWEWVLSQIEHAWIASLVRACARAAGNEGVTHDLDRALDAIVHAFDGDDTLIDSLWRLGGRESIISVVKKNAEAHEKYRHLGYTWSFDE